MAEIVYIASIKILDLNIFLIPLNISNFDFSP